MKKGNTITYRFFSALLASTLIAGVVLVAPASYGSNVEVPMESNVTLAPSEMNSVEYTLSPTVDILYVDLADKFFYQFAYVDVKKKVLVNGKMVLRYVNVDIVVLDEFARYTVRTRTGIKVGDIIRVSMADIPDNIITKWRHIK